MNLLKQLLGTGARGLCAAMVLLGCAWAADPALPGALSQPTAGVAGAVEPASYRVSRGDELNLRFYYVPELNTVATVRSDGRIALPLVGELHVDGLSMRQLTSLIETRLGEQVRRPQVAINVQGSGSQRIFVGGEVSRPGVQPLLGSLTALQAVLAAEGLRESALPSAALVLRRGTQGERLVLPVDLAALMAGTASASDIALQPFDVVVVPRSGIANMNLWIDQYVRRNLPFSLGFSYSLNRNGVVQ